MIDLLWATSNIANRIEKCEVLVDTETLSNHRYVVLDYRDTEKGCLGESRRRKKKMG